MALNRRIATKGCPVQRNQFIEVGRVLAAFGIVAFHTKVSGSAVFYSGLLFFLFLSPYLECGYKWPRTRSVTSLAITYLVPWAFWMFVYGLMNVLVGNSLFPEGHLMGMVFGGTSLHLWYMPAMFLVLVLIGVLKSSLSRQTVFMYSFLLIAGAIFVFYRFGEVLPSLDAPYYQWIHALPAILLGVLMGLRGDSWIRKLVSYLSLTVLVFASIYNQVDVLSVTYPVGIFLILVFVIIPEGGISFPFSVQMIANCMLGVYLSHIAFVRVFNAVVGRELMLTAILAFLASLAFTYFSRKYIPISKYVLG